MAEIKIQPKKPSILTYILYAIAVLAIVFLIIRSLSSSPKPVQTPPVTVDTTAVTGSVAEFLKYVKENDQQASKSVNDPDRQVMNTGYGMHLLAAAIGATVDREMGTDQSLVQKRKGLQVLADSINKTFDNTENAGRIKEVLEKASDLISSLQQKKFPGLNDKTQKLKNSVQGIDTKEKLPVMKPKIKNVLDQSGDILQAMAQSNQKSEETSGAKY